MGRCTMSTHAASVNESNIYKLFVAQYIMWFFFFQRHKVSLKENKTLKYPKLRFQKLIADFIFLHCVLFPSKTWTLTVRNDDDAIFFHIFHTEKQKSKSHALFAKNWKTKLAIQNTYTKHVLLNCERWSQRDRKRRKERERDREGNTSAQIMEWHTNGEREKEITWKKVPRFCLFNCDSVVNNIMSSSRLILQKLLVYSSNLSPCARTPQLNWAHSYLW